MGALKEDARGLGDSSHIVERRNPKEEPLRQPVVPDQAILANPVL